MIDKSKEILERGMTKSFCEFVDMSPSTCLLDSFQSQNEHVTQQNMQNLSILHQVESCSAL